MVEERLAALEARMSTLEARLPALPPAPAPRPAPRVSPPRPPRRDLEEFLGGSVLAWLGGAAVVAGLAFLLTVAVSRGWLGEGARTALAGVISLGLLGLGVRLRERRGRNDGALAAAAAGIAGAFATVVVAGDVYSLVPPWVALAGALAAGGAATALAVRWRAQVIGWIGLLGALLAPTVFAVHAPSAILFLVVAYASTVGVLVWQRWTALAFVAFTVATLQELWLVGAHEPPAAATAAILVAFGVLTTVAAIGFELRRREPNVRESAVALLVLNALVLDAAGAQLLDGDLWLVAVAAAHLAVGLAGTRISRVSRELSLIALGIGVVLSNVAFAALTSGLPLVLGWAAGAVGFGWLLRRRRSGPDRAFAAAGLGGHLLSALAHALTMDAHGTSSSAAGLVAVAAVAAGAAVSARLAEDHDPRWRIALDSLALVLVAYLSVLALDGVALAAAFAGQAVALAGVARREQDRLSAYAAAAFAGFALTEALWVAPPPALLDGLGHPLAAAGALAAAAGAAVLGLPRADGPPRHGARRGRRGHRALSRVGRARHPRRRRAHRADAAQRPVGRRRGRRAARRPPPRPARAAAGGAGAAGRHGGEGVPLRPRVADLALSRRLADRARPAAAFRGVRLAARAATCAPRPASRLESPLCQSRRTRRDCPPRSTRSCSRPRPPPSSRS